MQITEERRKRVIDLYFNQYKTYAEIAEIERISPRDIHVIISDIHAIIKEEESRRQKYKDQQRQEEVSSKAYKLFSKGKKPVEVAVVLNLRAPELTKLYREYWELKRLHILNSIYKETNGSLSSFLKLHKLLINEKHMSIDQVVNAVQIAIHKLPYMENLYRQAKDEAEKMQRTVQRLANDIEALKYKISVLDKTAFTCEQDCKRAEQRVQELTDKKNRIEKLIANTLNGEGYSKLNQIAKENVKDIVAENRKLISTAFAAIILSLKADPQMVKLIQNISCANDGEQYKDNNNNITKYLEHNKDRILNLGEKNYENLVEAFTKNAIDIAASASFSNFISSLPQSSSTFSNSFDQINTYKIEEPDTHHNSNGNIVE